jgi:hypothetical protein
LIVLELHRRLRSQGHATLSLRSGLHRHGELGGMLRRDVIAAATGEENEDDNGPKMRLRPGDEDGRPRTSHENRRILGE